MGITLIKIVTLIVDLAREAIGKSIKNAIAFAFLECRQAKMAGTMRRRSAMCRGTEMTRAQQAAP
uniref:Uncharacterized protein n=1 Tax=Serratia marcescens TaxID=615 RepID=A0AAP8PST4_SERMA|nr:hypothetical protein C3R40_17035 [Serratia marcescens]